MSCHSVCARTVGILDWSTPLAGPSPRYRILRWYRLGKFLERTEIVGHWFRPTSVFLVHRLSHRYAPCLSRPRAVVPTGHDTVPLERGCGEEAFVFGFAGLYRRLIYRLQDCPRRYTA